MVFDRLKLVSIAEALDLSVTTVSRVLHNKPDVKQETRRRVLEYVQNFGHQPSTGRSDLKLIGVVDTFNRHRLSSYYNAHIFDGIDGKLYEAGYTTTIVHTESIEREQSLFDNVRILNRLSGVIWLEPLFNSHFHQIVNNHNIPCVVINSCEPGIEVDLVECNSFKAAKTATEYLMGLGHRSIAFIGGQLNYTNVMDRLTGYRAALEEAGIQPDRSGTTREVRRASTGSSAAAPRTPQSLLRAIFFSAVSTRRSRSSDTRSRGTYRSSPSTIRLSRPTSTRRSPAAGSRFWRSVQGPQNGSCG